MAGGSIKDAAGNDANLAVAASGSGITVNRTALTGVTASVNKTYKAGDVIELTRFLTGLALDLRARLSLRADEVPPLRLGTRRSSESPQLGWNTWLRGPARRQPATDAEFHFSAMGGQSWH